MAYTHSKYEVVMTRVLTTSGNLCSTVETPGAMIDVTGVVAAWSPGYVPHAIKGAAVRQYEPTTNNNAIVYIGFNADITTAGTATRMFTIACPTTLAPRHRAYYWEPRASNFTATTLTLIIQPGRTVEAAVTAAATDGVTADIILYVEPVWEEAGNLTGMTLSTTV